MEEDRGNELAIRNLLYQVGEGRMRCYALARGTESETVAIVAADKTMERGTEKPVMYIWGLSAFAPITLAEWASLKDEVQAVRKGWGCAKIGAQTDNPRIVQIICALGGRVTRTVLEF